MAPAVPPPAAVARDPIALVKEADSLLLAGKNAQAVDLLVSVIGDFPDHAPAWDLLTYAYIRMNRFKAAQATGERAAFLAPNSATARFNAGLANARAGDYKRAAEHLGIASSLNGQQPDPSYYLGAVLSLGEAAKVYQMALAKFPDDKDLKRAAAALAGDLTTDGKAEVTAMVDGAVVVQDGDSYQVLLRKPVGAGTQTRIVDLGGGAPALILFDATTYSVYVSRAGAGLVEAGQEVDRYGTAYYDVIERAIVSGEEKGNTRTFVARQVKDGKLVVSREWTAPLQLDAPNTQAALFESVIALNELAFADEATFREVERRVRQVGQPPETMNALLLPASDGDCRIQISVGGRPVATGQVQLTSDGLKIARVQW